MDVQLIVSKIGTSKAVTPGTLHNRVGLAITESNGESDRPFRH